jgi:hypothetical protein
MRRSSFTRVIPQLSLGAILLAAVACNSDPDPDVHGGHQTTPVPSARVAIDEKSLFVVKKDGHPCAHANLAKELPTLQSLNAAGQEEYILKRALVIVTESVLSRKECQSAEHFSVRLILVSKLDEYGRPKWGEASQLALLELDRAAVQALKPEAVDALSLDRLRGLFTSRHISLECISQVGKP